MTSPAQADRITIPENHNTGVRRISISLPAPLAVELDRLATRRGFVNRSQAVAEMIHRQVSDWQALEGGRVMAGTITLFYDDSRPNLRQRLAGIQRDHLREVISAHRVLLEHGRVMEVLLVQGPAAILRHIADQLMSCRGVRTGELTLSPDLLPPLHAQENP
jgi:CopG family nickel-responsive transcriptional regulator